LSWEEKRAQQLLTEVKRDFFEIIGNDTNRLCRSYAGGVSALDTLISSRFAGLMLETSGVYW
jgi:hypothetical protein